MCCRGGAQIHVQLHGSKGCKHEHKAAYFLVSWGWSGVGVSRSLLPVLGPLGGRAAASAAAVVNLCSIGCALELTHTVSVTLQ